MRECVHARGRVSATHTCLLFSAIDPRPLHAGHQVIVLPNVAMETQLKGRPEMLFFARPCARVSATRTLPQWRATSPRTFAYTLSFPPLTSPAYPPPVHTHRHTESMSFVFSSRASMLMLGEKEEMHKCRPDTQLQTKILVFPQSGG